MSVNWYANEELGRIRNQDDIRAARQSRLIAEAVRAVNKISLKDKLFGALGTLMVRSDSWLQKQSRIQQEAFNSFMDASDQNSRACATC